MSMPTTPLDDSPLESDPALDHPWALWAAFRGMRSWFFQRRLPPTLNHPRFAVRLLRMLTLMGILGMVSVMATTGTIGLEEVLNKSGVNNPLHGMAFMILPGVWFGLCVLAPLSRWQGRNWWLTILAVPISAGVYWCAVLSYVPFAPIFSSSSDRSWLVAGLAAGAVGGLGLSIWMNPLWRWRAAWVTGPTLLAAVCGSLGFGLFFNNNEPPTGVPEALHHLLFAAALFAPFHISVAMALGLRLVWSRSE
ncbi:MAG TPA: hypothetical protein VFG20_20760 [Planctomycetaceae bacterium]|nr:hypothetical protein [Planctomycetaceae bacterium]